MGFRFEWTMEWRWNPEELRISLIVPIYLIKIIGIRFAFAALNLHQEKTPIVEFTTIRTMDESLA